MAAEHFHLEMCFASMPQKVEDLVFHVHYFWTKEKMDTNLLLMHCQFIEFSKT